MRQFVSIPVTITLTPEQEQLIRAQMATGQFRSAEEVIDTVLSSLKLPGIETGKEEQETGAQLAAERIRDLRRGITLKRPQGMSLREYAHVGHKY